MRPSPRLKKLGPWLGALLLTCLVLLALQWRIELHWGTPGKASTPSDAPAAPQDVQNSNAGVVAPAAADAPMAKLLDRILRESEKVGTVTNDPKQVERDLNEWAEKLSAQDVQDLRQLIFEGGHSGDEVALSLDLLGRRPLDAEAANILTDYVLLGPSVETTEKSTFQLLALDGLIDHSLASRDPANLRRVQKESSDALLARRAGQALGALRGQNPTPAETDQKVLGELLEKTNR